MQDLGREKCAGPAFGHLYYSQFYSKWKPGLKESGLGFGLDQKEISITEKKGYFGEKNLRG